MKIFLKALLFLFLFFLFLFPSDKALALQTAEIFSTGTSVSAWDTSSNLSGAPNSTYATKTTGTLAGYWYYSDSLNIPLSATITSLVFNIYAQSLGNSSGTNGWSVYLNGASCSSFPNISLGNGVRTVTVDASNCTGANDFADVVQTNKGVLNMSSSHVVGYSRNSGSGKTYIWDSVGVYATYELPDPIPTPMPPSVELPPGSVWEWTDATSSATQKEGLTDIISVSAGSNHSLALKSDGTVWAWGSNNYGQLGIGTSGGSSIYPVQVKSPDGQGYLTDIKAIATGADWYSMALKNDGTVWEWGYNGDNARGTGIGKNDAFSKLLTPTQVNAFGGFYPQAIAIAAGGNHSLALRLDGSVLAWGQNNNGQIGNGCFLYNCSMIYNPTQVISSVVSIAAGDLHSLVAKANGTVWGWGRLSMGQLGVITNGWQSEQPSPVQIPGINSIKVVYAEDNMSMAISEDNTVFEWGSGRDFPDRNPRQVPDLENILAITGGRSIGAAIKEDGTVWMFNTNYLFARPVPGLSNIGSISIGRYVPNLAVVGISDSIPTPTPTPKTPLILIPGIGGSELKMDENYSWSENNGHGGIFNNFYFMDEKVWINKIWAGMPGYDDYFDILRMDTNGESHADLALTGNLFDGYNETINFFENNGYELNKSLFIFPYDWRKDVSLTMPLLDQKINEIKTQTGSQKVDIIAHSMGGLVARNYISDATKALNVRKLFTLGTPHLGSVDFLKNLRFGGCLTKSGFLTDLAKYIICLGVAPAEVKDIIQNMISGYELAPSQKYFDFYNGQDNNHLYPYKNNGQELNYNQIKSFLTYLNYNTDLFNPSELFHSLDNQLTNTNGVEITNVAGSGLETLGQIREKSVKNFSGNVVRKKDGFSINGDKTVPLFSASLIDYGNKSLLGNAKVFYTKQNHGDLVASGSALNLVKNVLAGSNYLPDGISVFPYSFSGTEMSIYSPVNIHVYDSSNNHTGPTADGDFEENIPGSSYNTLDDAKFIFLPNDGIYRIEFESEGRGSFDFKIRKYENDEVLEETLYKDIPLTEDTKAETEFDTSSLLPPVIQLDENGDGEMDNNINSSSALTGDAIYDESSPTTDFQISGILGNNGWFRSDVNVTLNPQDGSAGSGILKTEYSLDNGQTVNVYNGPFTISDEKINKLKFRSVDNAGNEEDPKETEIKIDKTAPEAKIFVDQNKQDLTVTGIDINSTTVIRSDNKLTKRKDDAFYIITDTAGNSLKLNVHEADVSKQDRLRISSVQYNDDPIKIPASNYFNVAYDGKKQRAHVKEQNFELKGEAKIRIQYDANKNKSIIIVRKLKQKEVRENRSGLILLWLATDNGALYFGY